MKLLVALLLAAVGAAAAGEAPDMYCGAANCYEVLGLPEGAGKAEVRSTWRRLALELHPDKNKSPGAVEQFRAAAAAAEVLSDDDRREAYDYYLHHKDAYLRNYASYYRYTYGPQTDVRYVLLATVAVISAIQYGLQAKHHRRGQDFFRYRKFEELRVLRAGDLKQLEAKTKKSRGNVRKEWEKELRAEVERMLAQADIDGGLRKPSLIDDVFAVQLVLLPWKVGRWLWWRAQWTLKYTVRKEPYSPEDALYLNRCALGLSEARWNALPDAEREKVEGRQLWEKGQLEAFREEMKEEFKDKNPNKWKKYNRWKKKA